VRSIQPKIEEKAHSLALRIPDDLPSVWGDRIRLEQILTNLLRNGIRHTPPGGIVAVVVSQIDDWIQVEVRDTGEGIAPKDLPLIWGRFYRGSGGQPNAESGAGLGLALVKELTETMGGTVAVESTLGEGSVFTVCLPKA
jgi:signal transduction histidine kinase